MNHLRCSSWLALGGLYIVVACSTAEKPGIAKADTIMGTWVLSFGRDKASSLLRGDLPLGLDFSSIDSVEIFCDPRKGERYTTYQVAGDTLAIHRTDSGDWFRYPHLVKSDTLFFYRNTDTVTYMRVNMSEFRMAPVEKIYIAAASWSWVIGLIFNSDGSMEVMSNGYESDGNRNPYRVNKIYKLNHGPVPFEKLNRSMQKLQYIARSDRGRQLYDSADVSCFDGMHYSILWESDSLRETTYSSCGHDFQFYRYNEYLIRMLELDGQTSPLKMIAYDSIIYSPIFYCGNFWDSTNLKKIYSLSEQLYIAEHLRSGSRISKAAQLPTTLLNGCGADRYSAVVRTDGRIFQINSGNKTYYVDAGKDLIAATESAIKRRR
jgi:hypothetical protein